MAAKVDVRVKFPSRRHAEIAYDVLRIDKEPKRNGVSKTLNLEENSIVATFSAELPKHVRVGVNSFFEAIGLCTETMNRFGPPATQYDHA